MPIDIADLATRFLASLRQSERLSPCERAAYETPLLEQLCRHAALETEFNRDRLAILFERGDVRNGRFQPEHWSRVPILRRAEAQANNAGLHARNVPPSMGTVRSMRTSGSSGQHLEFRRSELSDAAGMALFERLLGWHKFEPSARMCWIRSDPSPEPVETIGTGWSLAGPGAERFELSKAASSSVALEWLARRKPRYLMAPPSVVDALVDEMERGFQPVQIEAILVTSETPREGLGERVARVFGAKLVDSYGTREIGVIAVDCPDCAGIKHIQSETVQVEIIMPDGTPAKPGETGQVVVTPFYNYGTPIIRYDVGDLATLGAGPCACGRTLPTLGAVLGRQNDLFLRRDGTRFYPSGRKESSRYLSALQLQLVQTDFEAVEVRFVPDPASTQQRDYDGAIAHLRDRVHPDIHVTFVEVDDIPRGPGGKFADLICRVGMPSR